MGLLAGAAIILVAAVGAAQAPESLSSDEVRRIERKKQLDTALQRMRESFARDADPATISEAIAMVEQLDPGNGSVKLYRNMLARRKGEGRTTAPLFTSTVLSSGSLASNAYRVSAIRSTPTPAPSTPAPTPAVSQPAPVSVSSASPAPAPPTGNAAWLYGIAGVVVFAGIFAFLRARGGRTPKVPAPPAIASPPTETAPPRTHREAPPVELLFVGKDDDVEIAAVEAPPKPDADPAADVAAQFATSLSSGISANLPPPTFDISQAAGEETVGKPLDELPTILENVPTVLEHEAEVEALVPASPEPPPAATPKPPDLVSFAALGIVPAETQEKFVPTEPVAPPPAAQPAVPAPPVFQGFDIPVRLDDIKASTDETMPATPKAPAPPAQPPHAPTSITLDDLLFNPSPAPPAGTSGNTPEERLAPSVPLPPPPPDYAGEETIHGMDTIILAPPGGGADKSTDETQSILPLAGAPTAPPEPANVPVIELSASSPASGEGFYGTGSAGSGNLDERSERMFREQVDKGLKAVAERDWKQAVHYLSIAAAIHPDNDEVRTQLRAARDEKKRSEKEA